MVVKGFAIKIKGAGNAYRYLLLFIKEEIYLFYQDLEDYS